MMKYMKRYKLSKMIIPVLILVVAASTLMFIKRGHSQVQPYYSGDAVYFNNQLVIGTTNTGYLEIYTLNGGQLNERLKIKSYNTMTGNYDDFSDLKLSVENGDLYVYAVSQYTLFKYDFSDLQTLGLVAKTTNTYWDWYKLVDIYGSGLGTVSDHGVKTFNSALQITDSYNFTPSELYSLRASGSSRYLFGFNGSTLQVYDRYGQAVVREIPVNFNSGASGHKIYFDNNSQTIYLIDDFYTKKYSLDGQLLASFKHLDASGYEVAGLDNEADIYFTNGLGVVKLRKSDLHLDAYAFTTMSGGPQGWAMGLKAVGVDNGTDVVVFNNTNILVLDKNLKKIASVRASEAASPSPQEGLYLNLNQNSAASGMAVSLSGGGFWPNENLNINFASQTTSAQADKYGRFNATLIVPVAPNNPNPLASSRVDIRVSGLSSNLSYSLGFTILP